MSYTTKELIEIVSDVLAHNNQIKTQFGAQLQLEVTDGEDGETPWVTFSYHAIPEHLNPYVGVHGGISAAILDTSMGVAAAGLTGHAPTTTELSLSYLRAMPQADYIVKAEFPKIGKHLVACNSCIMDNRGRKYVTAQARYALMGPLETDYYKQ